MKIDIRKLVLLAVLLACTWFFGSYAFKALPERTYTDHKAKIFAIEHNVVRVGKYGVYNQYNFALVNSEGEKLIVEGNLIDFTEKNVGDEMIYKTDDPYDPKLGYKLLAFLFTFLFLIAAAFAAVWAFDD